MAKIFTNKYCDVKETPKYHKSKNNFRNQKSYCYECEKLQITCAHKYRYL